VNVWWSILALLAGLLGDDDRDVACLVLGGLDSVRAGAYAVADPALLRRAYASAADAAPDEATLREYRQRGLEVRGAVMRRESCAVTERDSDRIELRVTDRLAAATANDGEGRSWALPRDRATPHRVTLVRTPDGWRIGTVR
jgi:hypothetical protein